MKPFDLLPGEWWKAPEHSTSKISNVYVAPLPTTGDNQASVVNSWGGSCFDSLRGDIINIGGGHTDYSGNEGYAFSVNPYSPNFLKWRVKWNYSAPTSAASESEEYSDGSPASAHIYCGVVYHPFYDLILRTPGVFRYGSVGDFTKRLYALPASVESPCDPVGSRWRRLADGAIIFDPTGSVQQGASVVNPWDNKLYCYERNGLSSYDFTTNVWTGHTSFEGGIRNGGNACFCITDRVPADMINVGGAAGNVQIRSLASPWAFEGGGEGGFGTSGDTNIEGMTGSSTASGKAPGIAWDTYSQLVVAWGGTLTSGTDNRDLYYLDLSSKVWTRRAGFGDIPPNPNANGIFNRFHYLAPFGICSLVNSTTEEVYFVRPEFQVRRTGFTQHTRFFKTLDLQGDPAFR